MRIPPLKTKILLESNPLKSRISSTEIGRSSICTMAPQPHSYRHAILFHLGLNGIPFKNTLRTSRILRVGSYLTPCQRSRQVDVTVASYQPSSKSLLRVDRRATIYLYDIFKLSNLYHISIYLSIYLSLSLYIYIYIYNTYMT